MKNIAIFASGRGSNAERIIQYFKNSGKAKVALILSNKKHAGAIKVAGENEIPAYVFSKEALYETDQIKKLLQASNIDLIVLAGFLLKVPENILRTFPDRIVNIHPALLPEFGGKGMYGMNVHKAVKASGKKVSGITIHLVNENYDEGKILFQAQCPIDEEESAEAIAEKVQELEHKHFPRVIDDYLESLN